MARSLREGASKKVVIPYSSFDPKSIFDPEFTVWRREAEWPGIRTLQHIHSNDSSSPSIYWVTLCWGKRNTQTSWGLMDTGYELILIPKDLKCHHVPLVRIGADESSILNGLLVYVEFMVAALSLQNHSVVIFLISEYIMWKDVLMVGTSSILVPWPVESELFVNKKSKWKILKPPSPSLARIVNENVIAS